MPSSARLRRKLVGDLEQRGVITTEAVRDAFLAVPREVFVPEVTEREGLAAVYSDRALVAKQDAAGHAISSSSQPTIMASMLEQLRLEPGHRVLEVGAGTGYNAALIKTIVGRRGGVTTVDVDRDLVRRAGTALREGGYRARAVQADARSEGLPPGPFDRIIVTASSSDVPRTWFERLAPGGLLQLPLRLTSGMFFPQLVVTFRAEGGRLVLAAAAAGAFMTLRGVGAGAGEFPTVSVSEQLDGSGWTAGLQGDGLRRLPRRARRSLPALLAGTPRRRVVARGSGPAAGGLLLYAALAAPHERLVGDGGWWTTGLVDRRGESLALLRGVGRTWRLDEQRARVELCAYGTPDAADALGEIVAGWRALGRPAWTDLRIAVGYGRRPRRVWRTDRRGDCVLAFDWARSSSRVR